MPRWDNVISNTSLADVIRSRKKQPKKIQEFFNCNASKDADFLSSLFGKDIQDRYNYTNMDFIKHQLRKILAHASHKECIFLTSNDVVLCIHKRQNGRLEYKKHKVGHCPIIKTAIEKYKKEEESDV
jgi:hypothetical protein